MLQDRIEGTVTMMYRPPEMVRDLWLPADDQQLLASLSVSTAGRGA